MHIKTLRMRNYYFYGKTLFEHSFFINVPCIWMGTRSFRFAHSLASEREGAVEGVREGAAEGAHEGGDEGAAEGIAEGKM